MAKTSRTIRSPVSGRIYSLGDFLGEGGFGAVYRARELNAQGHPMDQIWCIKLTDDPASWHREAYFGELLAGNNRVIRVRESFPTFMRQGPERRVLYCLVLEFARHGSLGQWLARTRQQWTEARIKREVVALLRVLEQLHGGGARHRDLTPFNVLVCTNGILKIGDFGLARHSPNGRGLAASVFAPWWAPPGIADGVEKMWLEQDDIYQMAQLLAALVRWEAREPISTKAVRFLSCSDALKAVIRRAIGDRAGRYRTVGEMIAAIRDPATLPTGGVSTLKGKVVAFTGPLSIPRRNAERWVARAGGKVTKDVTGQTDVLVRGEESPIWIAGRQGKKLLDAARVEERGGHIRVINERQFRRLVRQFTSA
jgi:serine/threonine protein kinase